MKKYLLPNKGNYYKANLHAHTNLSDGSYTPEKVKKLYKEKGYSVVAYTDHQYMIPHNDLTDDEFLAITGVEYACNKGLYDYLPSAHLNFLAKDKNRCTFPGFNPDFLWDAISHMKKYLNDEMRAYCDEEVKYCNEDFNKLIERLNEDGFLVAFNHPRGSLQNFKDYGELKGLWGMECHNGGPSPFASEESYFPLVEMHREGEKVLPIAADDTHHEDNLFGGFNMIKAEKLDYDVIMKALEDGEFYASEAPLINDLYIEDGVIHVETSEARAILLRTMERYSCNAVAPEGKSITSAEFDIKGFLKGCEENKDILPYGNYIRIEVVDKDFKKAYTRCYYIDELK